MLKVDDQTHDQPLNERIFERVLTAQQAEELCAALQRLAQEARVQLPDFPREPKGCCGRGCQGCVWEGFFEAVQHWRERALSALGLKPRHG